MVCIFHHISKTRLYLDAYPGEASLLYDAATEEDRMAIRRAGSVRRQKEILMTRRLLREALGPFCGLGHDRNGAPFVPGADCHISISHCADMAAVAVNDHSPIGIDLELWRDQIHRVRERFLSAEEIGKYDTPESLLSAWTMKEALYKVAGAPGLTLSRDIRLPSDWRNCGIAEVSTPSGEKRFRVFEFFPVSAQRSLSLALPC